MNLDNASIKFNKNLFVDVQIFLRKHGYVWNFKCNEIVTFDKFKSYRLKELDYNKNIFYLNTYIYRDIEKYFYIREFATNSKIIDFDKIVKRSKLKKLL